MKPSFALSLSFEGIGLLHRAFPGWNRVGEVGLDSPDLPGALAVLRETAQQINGKDIHSKLVIPNDQVRYLTLDLGLLGEDERNIAVREALKGATPYPVEDLVFDWSVTGEKTLVAAVARETLQEAENFATAHGFGPMSFVAIPPEGEFAGEPFFGATEYAKALLGEGEAVQRDMAPIRVTGVVRLPDPEDEAADDAAAEAPAEEPVEDIAAEADAASEPEFAQPADDTLPSGDMAEASAPAAAEAPAEAEPAADPIQAALPEEAEETPAPVAETAHEDPGADSVTETAEETPEEAEAHVSVLADALPGEDDPVPSAEPELDTPPDTVEEPPAEEVDRWPLKPAFRTPATPEPDPVEPEDDAPSFSTIRASRDTEEEPPAAPSLSGVTRGAPDLTAPSIPIPFGDDEPDASEAVAFEPESEDEAPAPSWGAHDDLPPAPPLYGEYEEAAAAPADFEPAPEAEPAEAEPAEDSTRGSRLSFFSQRGSEIASGVRASLAARQARRVEARASEEDRAETAPNARISEFHAQPPALTEPAGYQPPDSEEERMTIFGQRQRGSEKQVVGGKPRYLGLMLTGLLLLFLAGVAAWASLFGDEGLSSFFRGAPVEQQLAQPSDTPDELAVEGEEAMVPTPPADAPAPEATGEDVARLQEPTQPQALPITRTQPSQPHALTTAEASARYAVTGVWQRAPDAPGLPGQHSIEDLYTASIDPVVDAQDAVALPEFAALDTDVVLSGIAPPVPPGSQFDLDERGLVVATAAGAITPEGFLVFAGQPPRVPAAMPRRQETPTPQLSESDAPLAGIRPRSRPEGLIEQTERETLGGLTRAELAGKRPKIRPRVFVEEETAAPAPEPAVAAADQQAIENAIEAAVATPAPNPLAGGTEQAVALSKKPEARPRNFSRIVQRAERRQEQAATPVAAAVSRNQSVAPKVPSRASVAKAATVRNQLNLRKVNLIGVYGKPSARRALVRLANGRYKKVKVGDRLDGGRVQAIGDSELRYSKNGRNVVLKMPRG